MFDKKQAMMGGEKRAKSVEARERESVWGDLTAECSSSGHLMPRRTHPVHGTTDRTFSGM